MTAFIRSVHGTSLQPQLCFVPAAKQICNAEGEEGIPQASKVKAKIGATQETRNSSKERKVNISRSEIKYNGGT